MTRWTLGKGTWVLSSKQKVSHVKVKKQKIVVI